jgi:hypothetical protein
MNDQLAGGTRDAYRTPGHPQQAVIDVSLGLDLELVIDRVKRRIQLERNRLARCLQLAGDP